MTPRNPPLFVFLIAFGTGGLLTLMVLFNGQLAAYGTAMFASWTAHGTGTVAALVFLLITQRRPTLRDLGALALICSGSLLIIFSGAGA